jgi:dihydroneopterin aldolase/2-amino-4-hydroxy-6-hydroxymethyldihydropteridine diphosphokinase
MDTVIFDNIPLPLLVEGSEYLLCGELGLVDAEEGRRITGISEIDAMIETAREALTAGPRDGADGKDAEEAPPFFGGGPEEALAEAAERILVRFRSVRSVRLSLLGSGGLEKRTEESLKEGLNCPDGKRGISIHREWHTSYIGIGSNLGDRERNIDKALELIDASRHSRIDEVSPLYETEPVGYLEQGRFLNGVCRVETLLGPRGLIRFLLEVESHLFRERSIPNGPRTIDLDVLFYDDRITSYEEAVIPHPRLHSRMFVLKPLTDLAPYLMHPVLGERCYRLKEMLAPEQPEPPVWEGPVERGTASEGGTDTRSEHRP